MGESIGSRIVDDYRELRQLGETNGTVCVAVLSETQGPRLRARMGQNDRNHVFVQPVNVTKLRKTIERGLKSK